MHAIISRESPGISLQIGHYATEHFWLRAYAEFIDQTIRIIVFLNFQEKSGKIEIFGDISYEDGRIIQEFKSETVENNRESIIKSAIRYERMIMAECKAICALLRQGSH
jgi:hypothetical protein